MVMKSSHFLDSFNPSIHNIQTQNSEEDEAEEFNESDVVWSSSLEETTTTTSAVETTVISPSAATGLYAASGLSTAAGLSTALLSSNEPRSPASIQRKTTTSPVSMISSSLGRSNGSGSYYFARNFHQSAPVNVPVWPNGLGKSRPGFGLGRFDEVDDIQDDGEMVPPHEIVARSHNASSFSVFEGAGRTLKGRDLTTVRNSVFQKTGFL